MNYFKGILSLSIILLLFMNVVAILSIVDISTSSGFIDQSLQKGDDPNTKITNYTPQAKTGSQITLGRTTLKTDKDSYAPGEWVEVTAESTTSEMNGSLEWSLESPISEVAFDFSSEFQDIFEDRFFDDPTIPDWINDGFLSMSAPSGSLELTEDADADTSDVEVYYYAPELNPGKYEISFDYFSEGQNLLLNPGFEGGDTTGWDFNSLFVKAVEDPDNASEGDYYAQINGTEGFLLNQTVDVVEGVHKVTLIVKATGHTDEGYWSLKLEAYNSTNDLIGEKENYPTTDSREGVPDDKGYITQIMNWETPENTTKILVAFRGRNQTGVDALFTGRIDDCYLGEVPPSLKFSYWGAESSEDSMKWRDKTLSTDQTTLEWVNYTFQTYLDEANISKTFRFILPDENSFANNATSYWFIDNMRVDLVTVPEEEMGPIVKLVYKDTFSGSINSSWIHRGFHENLTSTYEIEIEPSENATTPSDCSATIQLQLPEHQVYFGSWIFVFKIHQIDDVEQPLDIKTINMSFVVEEPMNYVVQDFYMLRGSTNETQGSGNDTQYIFTEYFEKESNIQALSPGDNVTLLGFIEANSTRGEWYSLDYLVLGPVSVEYHWESNWYSRENITWTKFGFIPYNKEGKTILDGNFTSPFNNATTMALNFKIPNRGIYGDLSANLSIIIHSTNRKDTVGGASLTLEIPIDLPPVKFKVNIIEENLPAPNYYITDYLEGNITVEFHNYNDTLETDFPNRSISVNLTIPMSDLELTIFLDNMDQSPSETDISQQFHYHFIGKSVLWLDPVNPNLESGEYRFLIRWNAPYRLGIHDQDILISHFIQIKGSPIVIPADEFPDLEQGAQKTLNFSVHIDNATGKFIKGLDLVGLVDNNESLGKLVIYEEEGVYKIDLDIDRDAAAKEYTIDIYIVGRSDAIGNIKYTVIEVPLKTEEPLSPIDIAIGFGGFIFFILVSLGIIGALYWANKALK